MDEYLRILKRYFGYTKFRGNQHAIIQHVARGNHALVIMPTGMGKSLCFQIPALLLAETSDQRPIEKRPLSIVISPLIALMKDQVDALVARGIDASFVNSSLGKDERNSRYRQIAAGDFDLLYVTPERFRKADFNQLIRQRQIGLLAVDEAHCISQWGHDFRPDYTRLAEIRQQLGEPVTIALTATATPDVQKDIVEQLGLTPPQVRLFHQGIERPNLSLENIKTWGDDEKLELIVRTNESTAGAGIVYFSLIRTLDRFSELLRQRSIHHLVYHGDLPRHQRKQIQDWFMEDDCLVLATNAFGMGIDKESIRFVIHAELPGSLESYYQEIGRAGRDGLPSKCILLYDEADLETQLEFMRWSNPDVEFYQRVCDLLQHESEKVMAFGIDWLKEKLHARQRHDRRLETALGMLERHKLLTGNIRNGKVKMTGHLPESLSNKTTVENKLKADQRKLYQLVQFANHQGDLKEFIHNYFGVATRSSDEGV